MKRSFLWLAACVLLIPQAMVAQAAAAPAAAGPRWQQIIEVNVKPGMEMVYENYVKKIVAAAVKGKGKVSWTTFSVMVGKPGGTYRIVLTFNTWAERDSWGDVGEMLTKAFGQVEAERLMKEGGGATERSVSEVWENLPALGTNAGMAAANAAPPNFYRVVVTRVGPSSSAAYEALLAKFKPAYDAAANKPVIARSVLRYGAASGSTYRRSQEFNSMSDLDAQIAAGSPLPAHFGAEWQAMSDELNRVTVTRQEFISARRAELSYTAK